MTERHARDPDRTDGPARGTSPQARRVALGAIAAVLGVLLPFGALVVGRWGRELVFLGLGLAGLGAVLLARAIDEVARRNRTYGKAASSRRHVTAMYVRVASRWFAIFAAVGAWCGLFYRVLLPVTPLTIVLASLAAVGLGISYDVSEWTLTPEERRRPEGGRVKRAPGSHRWPTWRIGAAFATGALLVGCGVRLRAGSDGNYDPISGMLAWTTIMAVGGGLLGVAATAGTRWRRPAVLDGRGTHGDRGHRVPAGAAPSGTRQEQRSRWRGGRRGSAPTPHRVAPLVAWIMMGGVLLVILAGVEIGWKARALVPFGAGLYALVGAIVLPRGIRGVFVLLCLLVLALSIAIALAGD